MYFKGIGILFIVLLFHAVVFAQSISNVRKQKEKAEKEITYLNKLLDDAAKNKSASTEKLNILQEKIVQSKKLLNSLDQEVKYLQDNISKNEQRIGELQSERGQMLDLYSKLVYGTWKKRNKTNKLMFIFSSSDFNQAYNRFKYFQQIQEYSGRQLQLIRQVNDSLDLKNQDLKSLVAQKNALLNVMGNKNKELESEKMKENDYVTELQKKEKDLRRQLEKEMKNRQKLTQELNKLIAQQTKKSGSSTSTYKLTPEEKLVSDDFVKNQGKLPWPVTEGFISEKFGINVHAVCKKVESFNSGIDITTSKNADVRTVFQGVVSEIWYTPDLNYTVIIRHGNYLTVYSNLLNVSVKKGAKVNTKDMIGKVAYDAEKGSVLSFQLWKENQTQNPALWLAK